MCTVTYLPLGNNKFILTSNRDETPLRNTIHPKEYLENGVKLTYPKDELAGGTWVGLSDKKRLVCLLNGGFKTHKRKSSYRMSRGIIVKDILAADDSVAFIENFNFTDNEPFTIVLVDWNDTLKIHELVWDGSVKHFKELNQEPKIWSSSSLYTKNMKEFRREWFTDWLMKNNKFHQQNIIDFHKDTTKGNLEISLKMKRSYVETVSITSIKKMKDKIDLNYKGFINNTTLEL